MSAGSRERRSVRIRSGRVDVIEPGHIAAAASAIDDALESVISDPAARTADLGGPLGTKAFGERVAAQLTRTR